MTTGVPKPIRRPRSARIDPTVILPETDFRSNANVSSGESSTIWMFPETDENDESSVSLSRRPEMLPDTLRAFTLHSAASMSIDPDTGIIRDLSEPEK